MKSDKTSAIVLFSGGQDSATCLAWALENHAQVETVGFDYGQRHHVEMTARQMVRTEIARQFPAWAGKLGDDTLINLGFLKDLGETAMTDDVAIAMTDAGLPNTFVPGRNLAFLVAAGALAYRRGAGTLVGGMCETDYSGYPDCRNDTLQAQTRALQLGMESDVDLQTPLMHLTKAETWQLAAELGGAALIDLIVEHSHTCYLGDRGQRHEWGYGCGTCPACELRAAGWQGFQDAAA
jgi:7-cyano-7-deazaguanine synthase